MAKKVKKRLPKKKEVKVVLDRESVGSVEHAAYVLGLTGSIIVMIAAILFLIFPSTFNLNLGFFPKVTILLGLLNLFAGLAMLIASLSMKANPREAGVLVLVFSLIALIFPPNGLIIGPVLGIIGAVLILIKIR